MSSAIVLKALAMEARLLRAKLRVYDAMIRELEEKYGMSSDEFLTRFEKGELGRRGGLFHLVELPES